MSLIYGEKQDGISQAVRIDDAAAGGDWVVIDQDLGRVPEPAYAWRRLG